MLQHRSYDTPQLRLCDLLCGVRMRCHDSQSSCTIIERNSTFLRLDETDTAIQACSSESQQADYCNCRSQIVLSHSASLRPDCNCDVAAGALNCRIMVWLVPTRNNATLHEAKGCECSWRNVGHHAHYLVIELESSSSWHEITMERRSTAVRRVLVRMRSFWSVQIQPARSPVVPL